MIYETSEFEVLHMLNIKTSSPGLYNEDGTLHNIV